MVIELLIITAILASVVLGHLGSVPLIRARKRYADRKRHGQARPAAAPQPPSQAA